MTATVYMLAEGHLAIALGDGPVTSLSRHRGPMRVMVRPRPKPYRLLACRSIAVPDPVAAARHRDSLIGDWRAADVYRRSCTEYVLAQLRHGRCPVARSRMGMFGWLLGLEDPHAILAAIRIWTGL